LNLDALSRLAGWLIKVTRALLCAMVGMLLFNTDFDFISDLRLVLFLEGTTCHAVVAVEAKRFLLWTAVFCLLLGADAATTIVGLSIGFAEGNGGYGWWSLPLGAMLASTVSAVACVYERRVMERFGAWILRGVFAGVLTVPVCNNLILLLF